MLAAAGPLTVDPHSSQTEPRRVAVRVTRDALRQLRGGHPWVFDASVVSVPEDAAAGDLAVVFDDKRRFAAIGLYDPTSPLRVRILHHGEPRTIDDAFWRERLGSSVERRAELARSSGTTGYRVVHGENDGLPGLVLDRYDRTYVLKLDTVAWLAHLRAIVAAVEEVIGPDALVLRRSRHVADHDPAHGEGQVLLGELPEGPVTFTESGLTFEADVVAGQKTGFFLDQRDNRLRVRGWASGRRVLDVCSCTGGFSVNAAAGGAELVHSVDVSQWAIDAAVANMARNAGRPAVAACRHEVTTGDAFEVMSKMAARGRRFDLVVVDPPSFASSARQVPAALAAYRRLAELSARLVERGGRVLWCSCSSRVSAPEFVGTVREGVAESGNRLEDVVQYGPGIDHPVGFPQGAYLKSVTAKVVRR